MKPLDCQGITGNVGKIDSQFELCGGEVSPQTSIEPLEKSVGLDTDKRFTLFGKTAKERLASIKLELDFAKHDFGRPITFHPNDTFKTSFTAKPLPAHPLVKEAQYRRVLALEYIQRIFAQIG